VKEGGVSTYSFDSKTVVGLRGHVVEVDFEPGYTNWRSETHTPTNPHRRRYRQEADRKEDRQPHPETGKEGRPCHHRHGL